MQVMVVMICDEDAIIRTWMTLRRVGMAIRPKMDGPLGEMILCHLDKVIESKTRFPLITRLCSSQ